MIRPLLVRFSRAALVAAGAALFAPGTPLAQADNAPPAGPTAAQSPSADAVAQRVQNFYDRTRTVGAFGIKTAAVWLAYRRHQPVYDRVVGRAVEQM